MWTLITGFFSSTKNIIMAVAAMTLSGYVVKQKYDAYQAESKLKSIENKLAKANVIVAKEVAKAKAQSLEIETTTAYEVLKELKAEKQVVLKDMDSIEQLIVDTQKEKEAVQGRTRGKEITIEG